MIWEVGDVAPLIVQFTDINGNLADPTTVTLTSQAPDGSQIVYTTVSSPAIAHNNVGTFQLNLPITESGVYAFRWTGTGAVSQVQEGTLTVQGTLLVPPVIPAGPQGAGYTPANLAQSAANLSTGATEVRFQDRTVRFQTVKDQLLAQTAIANALTPNNPRRQYWMRTSTGLRG
jgi:hypothetical protein